MLWRNIFIAKGIEGGVAPEHDKAGRNKKDKLGCCKLLGGRGLERLKSNIQGEKKTLFNTRKW